MALEALEALGGVVGVEWLSPILRIHRIVELSNKAPRPLSGEIGVVNGGTDSDWASRSTEEVA